MRIKKNASDGMNKAKPLENYRGFALFEFTPGKINIFSHKAKEFIHGDYPSIKDAIYYIDRIFSQDKKYANFDKTKTSIINVVDYYQDQFNKFDIHIDQTKLNNQKGIAISWGRDKNQIPLVEIYPKKSIVFIDDEFENTLKAITVLLAKEDLDHTEISLLITDLIAFYNIKTTKIVDLLNHKENVLNDKEKKK